MIDKSRIREGMTVYSAEGDKLGKVISCDASTFIIEKGFFFPKDYVARFDDVRDVTGDDVHLSRGRDMLGEAGEEREGTFSGGSSVMGPGGGYETAPSEEGLRGERDVGRSAWESGSPTGREDVPEIPKRPVVKEEVRLREERRLEQRAADADVRREQVRVEGEGTRGEDIQRHLDPDEDVRATTQFGEDAGDLGPTRREPEE